MRSLINKSGFTLIEVMMVCILLTTGAAVAVWGINLVFPDLHLKAAVRNLKSDMQLARLTAIKNNTFTVSEFKPESNSYTIYLDDGAGDTTKANNYARDPGEATVKSVQIHPDVHITRAKFGSIDGRFAFNGRGALNGLAGGVYMKSNKNTYRGVAISRIGKITIKTSADGGNWHRLN